MKAIIVNKPKELQSLLALYSYPGSSNPVGVSEVTSNRTFALFFLIKNIPKGLTPNAKRPVLCEN